MSRTSPVEQRLIQLGIALSGTENFLVNTVPGEVWLPLPESPAAQMRELEAEVSDADVGWSSTVMILMAMLDHIKTVRTLIQPGNYSLFGAQVVTRSCLEAASRLKWIVGPDISPGESLRRTHALRCAGLAYQVKMYTELGADAEDIARRRAYHHDAIALATRHGAAVAEPPGHTRLVRDLFFDQNTPGIGAGVYNMLSSICHSSPPGLMEFFKLGEPPSSADEFAPEAQFIQPAVTLPQLELGVQLAAYGVSKAIDATLPFAGWPSDMWPRWRAHLLTCAFQDQGGPEARAQQQQNPPHSS